MNCPKCGNDLRSDWLVCSNCGRKREYDLVNIVNHELLTHINSSARTLKRLSSAYKFYNSEHDDFLKYSSFTVQQGFALHAVPNVFKEDFLDFNNFFKSVVTEIAFIGYLLYIVEHIDFDDDFIPAVSDAEFSVLAEIALLELPIALEADSEKVDLLSFTAQRLISGYIQPCIVKNIQQAHFHNTEQLVDATVVYLVFGYLIGLAETASFRR